MWQLSMHSSRRLRLPLLPKRGQLEGQPTTANLLQAGRCWTSQPWLAAGMRGGGGGERQGRLCKLQTC